MLSSYVTKFRQGDFLLLTPSQNNIRDRTIIPQSSSSMYYSITPIKICKFISVGKKIRYFVTMVLID